MLGKKLFNRKQGCLFLFIVMLMSMNYPATSDEVILIKDLGLPGTCNWLGETENKVFFVYAISNELWVSDGTTGGTKKINKTFTSIYTFPTQSVAYGDCLYFIADEGTHGKELWKSDGTDGGTVRITDINPGAENSGIEILGEINGKLLFIAYNGTNRKLYGVQMSCGTKGKDGWVAR